MYVFMYVYTYVVCIYTYIRVTSKLIRPHAVNASWFCVLFKFCFMREGAQGPPLVNPLNKVFFKFMMLITSFFFKKSIRKWLKDLTIIYIIGILQSSTV